MKISRKIAIIALLPIAAFVLQSARITHAINQAGTGHYGLQGESFFSRAPRSTI